MNAVLKLQTPKGVTITKTTVHSREWSQERRSGIGGSDFDNLVESSGYGCERKLYLDKSGFQSDYPDTDNYRLRRGKRQESVARDYYLELTKRPITADLPTYSRAFRSDEALGETRARYNPDGFVERDGELGVLEIKTLGVDSFEKYKKSGLPLHYALQPQWGAGILGLTFSSFAIFSPELDDLVNFDIEFNEEAFKTADLLASTFWRRYMHGADSRDPLDRDYWPPALEDGSTACKYCEFRKTCKNLVKAGTKSKTTLKF
tara:strand:+ start:3012 stop:3794 length:783 start_codon:yes stop_codon:yes gene_type:complete